MSENPYEGLISTIRKPVQREGAETFLRYTLLSFAVSVALTRLFLELTGYPQLGNSELHIAHVLWGGLLLFIASLLPLIFANRWVYTLGAICAGIGVGLFIDEVGKFITQTNDYFYPAAAPIIYAFFLLTVLVYFQVRKPLARDARSELYRALDAIEDVLDHDLDDRELAELKTRLEFVSQEAGHPDLSNLANALLTFLASEAIYTAPQFPSFWLRWKKRLQAFEARWLPPRRQKAVLAGGLLALGLVALAELGQFLWALRAPAQLERLVSELMFAFQISNASGFRWLYARLIFEASAGLMLCLAAVLLILGKDSGGLQVGSLSLMLSLTTVNLLVFYFEQFSTILPAAIQFLLLLGVIRYRRRYLYPRRSLANPE